MCEREVLWEQVCVCVRERDIVGESVEECLCVWECVRASMCSVRECLCAMCDSAFACESVSCAVCESVLVQCARASLCGEGWRARAQH